MFNRFCFPRIVISLVTSIATSTLLAIPAWAFTFSKSEGTFQINNFSHFPFDVQTFQDSNTQAIALDGIVRTNANANASFFTDQLNPLSSQANGFSSSLVNGEGNSYLGLARSIAEITGYQFQIQSGETFSFDFSAALNLEITVDQPDVEKAGAIGLIGLGLYDASAPLNSAPLEFLAISGNLGIPDSRHSLDINQSSGITSHSTQSSLDNFLGSNQASASASASVQGRLSSYFASPASLTLVKFSSNEAMAAVPEPSGILASLLCIGLVGGKLWRKAKRN
jgi:hypothetical protein